MGRSCRRRGSAISQDASAPAPQATSAPGPGEVRGRATFGQIFAVGEFRALWAAQVLSVAGDQLARVALTLLVFDRTHSPLLAAVTYAASVVPTLVGGIVLSGLADRLPRREVMIVCDLLRASLVGLMALSGVPVVALVCLLFLVTMIGAPFSAARAALYPDILPEDRYILGQAVTLTTIQFAQVLGFAIGGVVVGLFGSRPSLVADACTFVLSALIMVAWVRRRPPADPHSRRAGPSLADIVDGMRLVFGDPRLRVPMLLGWLVAFVDLYEGVAVPLARKLGGGASAAGLILASGALGAAVGSIAFSRLVGPARRMRYLVPLAVAACGVLILFAGQPDLPLTLVILVASGGFCCYQVAASAAFVTATPAGRRSQAFGIAQGGMSLAQGSAMIAAGAATHYASPSSVIAVGGALGVVAASLVTVLGARKRSFRPNDTVRR
jgi:MFS family permease